MKPLLTMLSCFLSLAAIAQSTQLSTIDFVQIVDGNKKEAIYYYQNNWLVLREQAVEKGYIDSFSMMEVPYTEEQPFHLVLITTYANRDQYEKREDHFGELIKARGQQRLLNDKKPGEFRKVLFTKDEATHLHRQAGG